MIFLRDKIGQAGSTVATLGRKRPFEEGINRSSVMRRGSDAKPINPLPSKQHLYDQISFFPQETPKRRKTILLL